MTELDNHYSQRVIFKPGKQREFILNIKNKLGFNVDKIAELINVSSRTLRDWKREKFSVSLPALKTLCKLSGVTIPSDIEIKKPFWYTNLGANKGWFTIQKRYGRVPIDEAHRKKKWYEWWQNKGKFQDRDIFHSFPFSKPSKSEKLAEFMGIMMGDGGMNKSQLSITLHYKDDAEFCKYVVKLIKNLFRVNPTVKRPKMTSVNRITVSRVELIKFLNNLGLVIGNKVKQQFDIPHWIKENGLYLKACIRGLVDTDGCVIRHKYKVNGKEYAYKKLAFTTMSNNLRKTVFDAFKVWGFNPRITQNRDVRLENNKDMKRYFELINSHNPKHLKKYFN